MVDKYINRLYNYTKKCTNIRHKMIEYEYFNWNNLINEQSRSQMTKDIDTLITQGKYWTNSPPFQTDVNVFGIPTQDWVNLKMSFIWSCFAYMQKEVQIKAVKSWGYRTSLKTKEDRDRYWHTHIRPDATVLSGVYYMHLPDGVDTKTAGTEFAPFGPEGSGKFFAEARVGHWVIWPGKSWHRPGILQSTNDRYIVAADMEF